MLLASRTIFLHFLSAFSVTEQVLMIKISGESVKLTFWYPFDSNILDRVDVSEKLSLHPSV